MDEQLKNNKSILFNTERVLTNIQELHYARLLQFFNCKNMNDLEVSFLNYCIESFLNDHKEELIKFKTESLKDNEEYINFTEVYYKEYLYNFEKKYNQYFKRGNYVKNR